MREGREREGKRDRGWRQTDIHKDRERHANRQIYRL